MDICACMVTFNEAENVEMAIESAHHICSRIAIVDDGSYDGTIEIARRTCHRLGFKNDILELKHTGKIYDTRNLALGKCVGDWILVTDGDFIWHTSGTNDSKGIVQLCEKYSGKNVHIYMSLAFLYGDYWHTLDSAPIGHPHPYLVENNPTLRCVKDKRFFKYTTDIPITKASTGTIYGFHAGGVKSAEMLLHRRFWTHWRESEDFEQFPTAMEYIRHYAGDDIEKASKLYFRDYMTRFVKFDTNKYGYYPAILSKKMREQECLRLLYENGMIVGRSDLGKVSELVGSFMKEGNV